MCKLFVFRRICLITGLVFPINCQMTHNTDSGPDLRPPEIIKKQGSRKPVSIPLQAPTVTYGNQQFNPDAKVLAYGKSGIRVEAEFDTKSTANEIFVRQGEGDFQSLTKLSQISSYPFVLLNSGSDASYTIKTVSTLESQIREDLFHFDIKKFRDINSLEEIRKIQIFYDGVEITRDNLLVHKKSATLKFVYDDSPVQKLSIVKASTGEVSTSNAEYGLIMHTFTMKPGQDKESFKLTLESGNEAITRTRTFQISFDDPNIVTSTSPVNTRWVRLSCEDNLRCPENTGVLFTKHKTGTGFCSTSYLGQKTFVTNAHCIPGEFIGLKNKSCNGYMELILPLIKNGSRSQKTFVCDQILDSRLSNNLDYAFYTVTEDPVIEPLVKGTLEEGTLTTWSPYSATGNFNSIELRESRCKLVYNGFETFPPLDISSIGALIHYGNPESLCHLAPGTSGSAMLNESGQWVGLHFSGMTNHTKKSGLDAGDFNLISIYNLKTGINTYCLPTPGESPPEHCTTWKKRTNLRVSDVIKSLPSNQDIFSKLTGIEDEFIRTSQTMDYYHQYDFDVPLFGYNKSRPRWHIAMPSPGCVRPNDLFYIPVCFLSTEFNEALKPVSYVVDRCENKTAFTMNNDLNIHMSEGTDIYVSYPHQIPTCPES